MMQTLYRATVAGLIALALVPNAVAVMVKGAPASASPVAPPAVIERGGTVEMADLKQRTLMVDGQTYALSAGALIIHGPSGAPSNKPQELKRGMKIRFNTSKANYSAQEQVIEIWIVPEAPKPKPKP